MKYVYIDENGYYSIHNGFISKKTIERRYKDSKRLSIYKCKEHEIELIEQGYVAGTYITTIMK